jgi:hypothetical protein
MHGFTAWAPIKQTKNLVFQPHRYLAELPEQSLLAVALFGPMKLER